MQIESIMMIIPAIQVGIVATATAYASYLMISSIYNKIQQSFSS